MEDVAGDDDGLPHAPQFLEQFTHLNARAWIETRCGLIHQEHLRIVQQHASHAEALLHAAAQTVHLCVGLVVEIGEIKDIADGAFALIAVNPIARCKELQVLVDQHVVVRAHEVRYKSDDRANQWVLVADGLSVNPRFAPRGLQKRRQNLDGGGLAGAVGTDEPAARAFIDLQVEVVQCDQVTVLLGEVDRLDHRHGAVILRECANWGDTRSIICWHLPVWQQPGQSLRPEPLAVGTPRGRTSRHRRGARRHQ